ncbi:MAG TPA: hypothetical protein VIX59_01170 [Candidatus Binataceae bacterium]
MAASPIASAVRSPQWVITYQGVNITGDISQMVLSIIYVDRLGAASGEAEIELEDHAKRWQGPWYPGLGDELNLALGYLVENLLPCGDFQVEEIGLAGPPDVLRLRCLATYVTLAMRTRNTVGYENQSLVGIAATIAAKYELALVTAPEADDLVFARITQRHETDLEFLQRLANEHGYDFSVRGGALVFYAIAALEAAPPIMTITRANTLRFAFRNRTQRIYREGQTAYFDPDTKELILQTTAATNSVATADKLKLLLRCENGQQALMKAEAALHRNDMLLVEARLTMPGTTAVAAGINVTISGWGALDGVYLVEEARHQIDRVRGYTTEVEARRVG